MDASVNNKALNLNNAWNAYLETAANPLGEAALLELNTLAFKAQPITLSIEHAELKDAEKNAIGTVRLLIATFDEDEDPSAAIAMMDMKSKGIVTYTADHCPAWMNHYIEKSRG